MKDNQKLAPKVPPLAVFIPILFNNSGFTGLTGQFLYPPCLRSDVAQNATLDCVTQSLTYYTSALLVLITFGAFIYLLYGATLYVSAFGDEAKVKQAKDSIKYAIIGMLIALLANLLVGIIAQFLQA